MSYIYYKRRQYVTIPNFYNYYRCDYSTIESDRILEIYEEGVWTMTGVTLESTKYLTGCLTYDFVLISEEEFNSSVIMQELVED